MARSVSVFERNGVVAHRIARVATAACDLRTVQVATSLAELGTDSMAVIGVEAQDFDLVRDRSFANRARFVLWAHEQNATIFGRAMQDQAITSVVAWPSFLSMPRDWELSLAFRAALGGPSMTAISARDVVAAGGFMQDWRVATSVDRDEVVAGVATATEKVSGGGRIPERVAGIAHELLMNAMYDAPVGPDGVFKHAQARQASIELAPEEAPTCRFATDGRLLAIEVVDPFGGLRREHVFGGIVRGMNGTNAAAEAHLDTSHGGAGLGFHRVFEASIALFICVKPRVETRVLAMLDLDLTPRELRGMPRSVHFF